MNNYKFFFGFLFIGVICACGPCDKKCCQQLSLSFDHMAIMCQDVDASAEWYMDVFETKEIVNQTGNPAIRWLSLGDAELHLVPIDSTKLATHKSIHMALGIPDIDEFTKRLDSMKIEWEGWRDGPGRVTTRPDGIRQVYIQDINGYWIEVNDALRTN